MGTERPPFPTATGADLSPVKKKVNERRSWMFSGPERSYHTDREEVAEGDRTRVHCDVWVEKDDASRILLGTASATRS